jgi:hypothetical protein
MNLDSHVLVVVTVDLSDVELAFALACKLFDRWRDSLAISTPGRIAAGLIGGCGRVVRARRSAPLRKRSKDEKLKDERFAV